MGGIVLVVLLVVVGAGVGAKLLLTGSDQAEAGRGTPAAGPTAAAGQATPAPSPSITGSQGAIQNAGPAVTDPDNLDCSGQFLVVFNLTNDVTELDTSQPWLEAENSCRGIDRTMGGKPLRFNYRGPYDSSAEACQQLLSMDPHSDYVKLLRANQSDGRHYLCSCDATAGELPPLTDSGGDYPASATEFRAAVDLHLMLKRVQGFESDNLGMYGQQTIEAVKAFQSAAGLPATGEVDSATWGRLLASPIACPA